MNKGQIEKLSNDPRRYRVLSGPGGSPVGEVELVKSSIKKGYLDGWLATTPCGLSTLHPGLGRATACLRKLALAEAD